MSDGRDSFSDLEKHRLRLEENVAQLQKALQHWRTWDAEYEALKEEVEAVSTAEELRRVHAEFDGELLKGKEIDDIFGTRSLKTREQIINVLERRIDYVSQNIETLRKQLGTAENKYAAATVISQPDATDEDGQPIMDIVEELDDDDNVISFRVNKPGESLGNVEALLNKAGITDDAEPQPEKEDTASSNVEDRDHEEPPKSKEQTSESVAAPKPPSPKPGTEGKKSVSFSDDTRPAEEPAAGLSWRAKRVKEIMGTAKEQEDISMQAAVIPKDESPEDSALRQQMLRYGMSEVGAVVAELELEEGESDEDFELDDDLDDELGDYDDEEDDEDQYGRYKGSVVTDKYRQRMLQLEAKLGIQSRSSKKSQPKPDEDDSSDDDNDEGIGRIVVNRGADASSSSPTATEAAPLKSNLKERQSGDPEAKKGVRFATSLDIAPEKDLSAPVVSEKKDLVEPLSDIVERTSSSRPTKDQPAQPAKRASRFKKAKDTTTTDAASAVPKGPLDIRPNFMDDALPPVPTGPEGVTIADTLVERESASAAIAPDEVNDLMTHQEVADEYQRMRKKFIQREGGFLKPDESPVKPVRDEIDGQPTSRFRAARLSRQ
ncbi:Prefoldin subunit domain-containing protein [Trichoderma novae-zelandiae]